MSDEGTIKGKVTLSRVEQRAASAKAGALLGGLEVHAALRYQDGKLTGQFVGKVRYGTNTDDNGDESPRVASVTYDIPEAELEPIADVLDAILEAHMPRVSRAALRGVGQALSAADAMGEEV